MVMSWKICVSLILSSVALIGESTTAKSVTIVGVYNVERGHQCVLPGDGLMTDDLSSFDHPTVVVSIDSDSTVAEPLNAHLLCFDDGTNRWKFAGRISSDANKVNFSTCGSFSALRLWDATKGRCEVEALNVLGDLDAICFSNNQSVNGCIFTSASSPSAKENMNKYFDAQSATWMDMDCTEIIDEKQTPTTGHFEIVGLYNVDEQSTCRPVMGEFVINVDPYSMQWGQDVEYPSVVLKTNNTNMIHIDLCCHSKSGYWDYVGHICDISVEPFARNRLETQMVWAYCNDVDAVAVLMDGVCYAPVNQHRGDSICLRGSTADCHRNIDVGPLYDPSSFDSYLDTSVSSNGNGRWTALQCDYGNSIPPRRLKVMIDAIFNLSPNGCFGELEGAYNFEVPKLKSPSVLLSFEDDFRGETLGLYCDTPGKVPIILRNDIVGISSGKTYLVEGVDFSNCGEGMRKLSVCKVYGDECHSNYFEHDGICFNMYDGVCRNMSKDEAEPTETTTDNWFWKTTDLPEDAISSPMMPSRGVSAPSKEETTNKYLITALVTPEGYEREWMGLDQCSSTSPEPLEASKVMIEGIYVINPDGGNAECKVPNFPPHEWVDVDPFSYSPSTSTVAPTEPDLEWSDGSAVLLSFRGDFHGQTLGLYCDTPALVPVTLVENIVGQAKSTKAMIKGVDFNACREGMRRLVVCRSEGGQCFNNYFEHDALCFRQYDGVCRLLRGMEVPTKISSNMSLVTSFDEELSSDGWEEMDCRGEDTTEFPDTPTDSSNAMRALEEVNQFIPRNLFKNRSSQ